MKNLTWSLRGLVGGLLSLMVLGLFSVPASAQTSTDPSLLDPQIYVCTGCTAPPGGEPDFINSNSINVGFAGNHTAVSPLLILVSVPNNGPAPTLSLPTGVTAAPGEQYYGLNAPTTGTTTGELEGFLTALSPTPNAYAVAGLATDGGGGSSESFVNYTSVGSVPPGTFPNGQPNPDAGVASFAVYAYAIDYALNSSNSGGNSPITIDLEGPGALNSFVIGYSCGATTAPPTQCDSQHSGIGETPFTNSGFVASVSNTPEPSSLLLFGFGVLALGFVMRRRLLSGED